MKCGQCVEDLPDVFRRADGNPEEAHDSNGVSEEEIQEEIDTCPSEGIPWKE